MTWKIKKEWSNQYYVDLPVGYFEVTVWSDFNRFGCLALSLTFYSHKSIDNFVKRNFEILTKTIPISTETLSYKNNVIFGN